MIITNILRIGQQINTRLMKIPKGSAVCPWPFFRLIKARPMTAPRIDAKKNNAVEKIGPIHRPIAPKSQ